MKLGKLAAMALAQGGAGFHILAPSVFNYISSMSLSDIVVCVEEVADDTVKELVQKVRNSIVE